MRLPSAVPTAIASLLLAVLVAPSFAQGGPQTPVPGKTAKAAPTPEGGVVGLDAMTSNVFQEGQSSFTGIALRLRLKSAALLPNVEILPAIELWQNVSRVSIWGIKTTRSDATLGCQARWTFTREGWQPYLGGGLAVHFLSDRVSSSVYPQFNQSNSTTRGGYSLLGGVTFPMTERLYNYVELEHHGVSHYRQLKFNTGLGWNF